MILIMIMKIWASCAVATVEVYLHVFMYCDSQIQAHNDLVCDMMTTFNLPTINRGLV